MARMHSFRWDNCSQRDNFHLCQQNSCVSKALRNSSRLLQPLPRGSQDCLTAQGFKPHVLSSKPQLPPGSFLTPSFFFHSCKAVALLLCLPASGALCANQRGLTSRERLSCCGQEGVHLLVLRAPSVVAQPTSYLGKPIAERSGVVERSHGEPAAAPLFPPISRIRTLSAAVQNLPALQCVCKPEL